MKAGGHEEALGYDNTLLLSVTSLGEAARRAASSKKNNTTNNANVTEYGGASDDESDEVDDCEEVGGEDNLSPSGDYLDFDEGDEDEEYVPESAAEFQELQHNEVSFPQNQDSFTSTPNTYVHGEESKMDDPWLAHRDRYERDRDAFPPTPATFEEPPPTRTSPQIIY